MAQKTDDKKMDSVRSTDVAAQKPPKKQKGVKAAALDQVSALAKDLNDANKEILEMTVEHSKRAKKEAQEAMDQINVAFAADAIALRAVQESEDAHIQNMSREDIKAARLNAKRAKKEAKLEHKRATKEACEAYKFTKFSQPGKWGFLRVIEVLFFLNIIWTLFTLIFTSRDVIVYSSNVLIDWLNIILEGVALWMFLKRFRVARWWMIGVSALNMILGAVELLITGNFQPVLFVLNSLFDIVVIVYFATSLRVRATFTEEISYESAHSEKDKFVINRKGWPFYRNLIIYFCVFSVVGHWMEMGMCQFIIWGLVDGEYDPTNTLLWRDWLYPFPMEGIAVVVIAVFLYPFKEWLVKKINKPLIPYVISFCANGLVCATIEFTMGLFVNADLQLWDYSDMVGNIMGQVCLQNTLAFGAAASIIAWLVYPMLERALARVPRDIMNLVFVAIFVGYGILQFLYLIDPPQTPEAISTVNQVVTTIKQ